MRGPLARGGASGGRLSRAPGRPGPGGGHLLEPDVTLTDLGLALECATFAALLWRAPRGTARGWFAAFFVVLAVAAALGAVAHGFVPDDGSRAGAAVWTATLLAVGLAAVAGWGAGAGLWLGERAARGATAGVAIAYAGYAAIVVLGERRFAAAIAFYLPAAVFLLAAFVVAARRGSPGAAAGAWGLGLTFVAAAIQQARVAVHPRYFDHNALYHAVQAAGLYLVFRGARSVLRGGRAPVAHG